MMGRDQECEGSCEALIAALRDRDDRARFVGSRTMRKIFRHERKSEGFALSLAHRRSLAISAASALEASSPEELDLKGSSAPKGLLLLIERPDDAELQRLSSGNRLLWGWRRLFHVCADGHLVEKIAASRLNREGVRDRIERIGHCEYSEIRGVLERDGWLMWPRDEVSVYAEFVAVFSELRQFSPRLIPSYFPGMKDVERVAAIVAEDLDAASLFQETKPDGASAPHPHPTSDGTENLGLVVPLVEAALARSGSRHKILMNRSDRARKLGNVVRSAILRTRAARFAGPSKAGQARAGAEDDLDGLARRLRAAVGEAGAHDGWRASLSALLGVADRGFWTVEARLLYDLQKVCVDSERAIYEIDLGGWLGSFGRKPLKRPLPNQMLVRMAKHLQKASQRLQKARIVEVRRAALSQFLKAAVEHANQRLRERFRPLIARSLQRADLAARNLPERASFSKTVEELLDLVVERGFLTMGDVRDAIARGQIRSPDLSGPRELWRGDRVLKANRRLKVSLEGVYRPGEIYLRTLQRASLLAFGTKAGRWLTRYVALPFGLAFGALVTLQELLGLVRFHREFVHWWSVGVLGIFTLGLLYLPDFRRGVVNGLSIAWRAVRGVTFDAPAWFLRLPTVRMIVTSRVFDLVRSLILEPLLIAGLVFLAVRPFEKDRAVDLAVSGVAYLTTAMILSTRLGREAEEVVIDASARGWKRVRTDLLPNILRFFVDIFAALIEGLERVIYAVDERLRFRAGQSRASLAGKAILGVFWGILTYVVRIYINLLIEPQINPVKHFPTVTVAAKMILPIVKQLADAIAGALWFLGKLPAYTIAVTTVFFLPGIAGFIVWELKENWRLFEANRPKNLRPVPVGHHGETIGRLLRPGFHSGTIPKLFTALRRADRKAERTGDRKDLRRRREALHHAEEAVVKFVDRDLIAFWRESKAWPEGTDLHAGHVLMATNRFTIAIPCPVAGDSKEDCRIVIDEVKGRLSFEVEQLGWTEREPEERRAVISLAVAGFQALAGVECWRGPERDRRAIPVPWAEWVAAWEGLPPVLPEIGATSATEDERPAIAPPDGSTADFRVEERAIEANETISS